MKKILLPIMLVAIVVASCVKDKGYDNHKYGINKPDDSPIGIGFPMAKNDKNTFGINLLATPQKIAGLVVVNLESGVPAAEDVTVTLALNPGLVTSYNSANGTNIQVLPTSLFTVPLTLTIPKGERLGSVEITIPNSSTFSATSTYGIGLSIASNNKNYVIADNKKNLLIEINIKNKYDGQYLLKGYHNRPGLNLPYSQVVDMITSGATSVSMYWPTLGDYAHPINGTSYYGSFTTNFIFNSSDKITAWDMSPWPTTLATTVDPTSNSRYVDSSNGKKYIFFTGWYNNNPGARSFFDTLTYLGPR